MLFTIQRLSVVTLALSFVAAVQATYLAPINPKNVVECGSLKFTYSGKAPFTISVWPGCDDENAKDEAITTYTTNSTTATWKINIPSGRSIMFGVEDKNKNFDWSDDFTVEKGSSACVGQFTSWTIPGSNTTTTATSPTAPIGNAGEAPTSAAPSSTGHPVGLTGGAVSSLSLRTEVAAFAVLGSIVASFAL